MAVLGFCNTGTFFSSLLGKLSEMGYFDGMNFRIHFLRANILKSSTFGIPLGILDGIHVPDSFSAFLTTLAVLANGQPCNCPHQTTLCVMDGESFTGEHRGTGFFHTKAASDLPNKGSLKTGCFINNPKVRVCQGIAHFLRSCSPLLTQFLSELFKKRQQSITQEWNMV